METKVNFYLIYSLGFKQLRSFDPKTNEEHENNEYKNIGEDDLHSFENDYKKGVSNSNFKIGNTQQLGLGDSNSSNRSNNTNANLNKNKKAISSGRKK